MITPIFVFTIFMLTLGPIKTVPGFYLMTKDLDAKAARALAIRGTLVATAISLLVALVMRGTAAAWQVSLDELRIAGGILLFMASRNMIEQFNRPSPPPVATDAASGRDPARNSDHRDAVGRGRDSSVHGYCCRRPGADCRRDRDAARHHGVEPGGHAAGAGDHRAGRVRHIPGR